MKQLISLFCAVIALGLFTIRVHAVEPPPPTSERDASIANTLENLGSEFFSSRVRDVTFKTFGNLERPKPVVGAWTDDPDALVLVLAIALVYGGISVISRGVPVTSTWIQKGTTNVVGILMIVIGGYLAISCLDSVLAKRSETHGVDRIWSGGKEIDIF